MAILTVGIPCYNEAATIGKVISDFRRVFPDAKILVIDNNSTDATGDIAKHYGADVLVEGRQGKGYAVQSLFREANSEWLLMVDGDDLHGSFRTLRHCCGLEDMRFGRGVHTDAHMGKQAAFFWDRKNYGSTMRRFVFWAPLVPSAFL